MTLWGATSLGQASLYKISDGGNCHALVSDFGGRLVELWCPDRKGDLADIVLGHDSPAEYETRASRYIGATCGRYANRIQNGQFELSGDFYQLDQNEGKNHLHGGSGGIDAKIWTVVDASDRAVTLRLTSPDGDMGYPGTLEIGLRYEFSIKDRFEITMTARVRGKPTVLNLVNHAYFNLAGQGSGPIDDQLLRINADHYTPVDANLIPLGITPVQGTEFDFRSQRPLGKDVPLRGFDHNFCLHYGTQPQITAVDPVSGRGFSLWTDQPGVQLYTAAHIPQGLAGKAGKTLGPRAGFTLETQIWPNSPNRPDFPNAVLRPEGQYHHRMVFDFFA